MHDSKIAPCFFMAWAAAARHRQPDRPPGEPRPGGLRRYRDSCILRGRHRPGRRRALQLGGLEPPLRDQRLRQARLRRPEVGQDHRTATRTSRSGGRSTTDRARPAARAPDRFRVESRLSLNYQLENDAGGILAALKRSIAAAYDVQPLPRQQGREDLPLRLARRRHRLGAARR